MRNSLSGRDWGAIRVSVQPRTTAILSERTADAPTCIIKIASVDFVLSSPNISKNSITSSHRPGRAGPIQVSLRGDRPFLFHEPAFPMQETQTAATNADSVLSEVRSTAQDMSVWLKVAGGVIIAFGIPLLIVLVGALYIWLGVLLWQAGTAAESNQPEAIERMMKKLKTFFIVGSILLSLMLLSLITSFASLAGTLFSIMQSL